MPDANPIAGVSVRVCNVCGQHPKLPKQSTCKTCYRVSRRRRIGQYAALSGDERRARNRRITARRQIRRATDAEYREDVNARKRAARRRRAADEGRKLRCPRSNAVLIDRLAKSNTRHAWRYWLTAKAPSEWMRAYYEASGKPWRNPRLSGAERYATRYRLDAAFAQRERERISARRFTNPAYAAAWEKQGKRWTMAARSDDGTVTQELLKHLRAQRHCSYCHQHTPCRQRHIDHVMPLAHGGAHSADNLVMACGRCNRRKRAMLPLQWLTTLSGSAPFWFPPGDLPRGGQGRAVTRNFSSTQALHYE